MFSDDTIAAVSTPPGESGIGIVRLSGPEAVKIASGIFHSPKGKRPEDAKTHTVIYGFIREACNPLSGGAMPPDPAGGGDKPVDEVLLTVMRAPNTYTREDVVEINCHGGAAPLKRVLELVLRRGARLAGPGEFTKRAFLSGRLDLSQAEAVMDIIRGKTDAAERLAIEQLRGRLSDRINVLRDGLVRALAHVEAYIDFPEDEIEPSSMSEIKGGLAEAMGEISTLAASYDEGKLYREGLKAAIAGRPNVGKSSLLNALLLRDRAIVTELPGTTRDVIEECLNIKGVPVVIMDTAGIREARDIAEEEGVRRTLRAVDEADIVLCVLDGSVPLTGGDIELLDRIKEKNRIVVINKMDLPQAIAEDRPPAIAEVQLNAPVVRVSAKTVEGLDGLKEAIYNSCLNKGHAAQSIMVTNMRHKIALDKARERLLAALNSIEREPLEITAMELRESLDRLGEIVGAWTTEELLDRIFNEFCIGK